MKRSLCKVLSTILCLTLFAACSSDSKSRKRSRKDRDDEEVTEEVEEETSEEETEPSESETTVETTETTETEPVETEPPKGDHGYIAEPDMFTVNDVYILTEDENYQNTYVTFTSHLKGNHQVYLRATAYDKEGKSMGNLTSEISVVTEGEEALADFYFYQIDPIDHLEYEFFYNDTDKISAYGDFTIEEGFDKYLVLCATNNGTNVIMFGIGFAFFFDQDGNLLKYDSFGFQDVQYEVKVGATEYTIMKRPDNCTAYRFYIRAERLDSTTAAAPLICPEAEIVETYLEDASNGFPDGRAVYRVFKNVSDKKYEFFSQSLFRDAATGNLLYYSWDYEVLNPGEEAVFYASCYSADSVEEIRISPIETDYPSVIGQMTADAYKDGGTVILSVTNNSEYYVGSPYVYFVAFDVDGNYMYVHGGFYSAVYLDPGKTTYRDFENQYDVASWKLYITTAGIYEEDPDPEDELGDDYFFEPMDD